MKKDILESKNSLLHNVPKDNDPKSNIDTKISTLVEQNSQIQNEMVKIHKIILGFPSAGAGFKGNLLINESIENDKQQLTENSKKESVNANANAIIENQNKEINMLKSELISLKNENNKLSSMKPVKPVPVEKNLSLKGNFVNKLMEDIQNNFLSNDKFKLSVIFIMRASLLAKNINYIKFVKVNNFILISL